MRLSFHNLPGPGPILLSGLLLWGTWACDGRDSPPGGLIPPDRMADILTDIHIAEARVSSMGLRSLDSSLKVYDSLQVDIWRHNKVDTSVYAKSYEYYTTHPELLAEIYDQVDSNITRRMKTNDIKF